MDTISLRLPDKKTSHINQARRARKIARTNRSPISKGLLVNPGENIQYAIDAVEKDGGGVVTLVSGIHIVDYNITIPSFVTLQGEGRDGTRVDFEDADYTISVTGTAASRIRNMRLRDLTVERSGNATAAVTIGYADHFILDNVRFSDNAGSGLQVSASQQYTVVNCLSDNNVLHGFSLVGDTGYIHARYTYIGCIATNNTQHGFMVTTASGSFVANGAFVACESDNNTVNGFDFNGSLEVATYLTNCIANGNLGTGFDLNASFISLVACSAQENDVKGINNTGNNNTVLGCNINDNNEDFQSTQRISVIGNSLQFGAAVDIKDTFLIGDEATISIGNTGGNTRTEKRVLQMKNGSGGTIAQGAVVVLKADAEGDVVTTTTTQGDDKVLGMAMFSIADGAYGAILVEGYTTLLKVDGTTDIAIGDLLGTFTTAGIAMKAAAGDMAIAYALEAYTTDDTNGVINALLITPRKL